MTKDYRISRLSKEKYQKKNYAVLPHGYGWNLSTEWLHILLFTAFWQMHYYNVLMVVSVYYCKYYT